MTECSTLKRSFAARDGRYAERIFDFVLCLVAWVTLSLAGEIRKPFARRAAQLCEFTAQLLAKLTSSWAHQLHANALVREGVAWAHLGDWQKSIALNDRAIERYRQSSDVDVLTSVVWGMVNKGYDLSELGRLDEAIAVYRALSESMPVKEPFLDAHSQGLMNWALDLSSMHRHDEENELYDRIQAVIGDTADLKVETRLAWSIVNKGITVMEGERYTESIELFDIVIRWNGVSVDTPLALHEALAAAGRHRCRSLTLLGRHAEAVDGAATIVARYASTRDRGVEEEVAWAALTKAVAQERLGHISDAQRTYEFVETRYRRSQPEQVSAARRMLDRMSNPGE